MSTRWQFGDKCISCADAEYNSDASKHPVWNPLPDGQCVDCSAATTFEHCATCWWSQSRAIRPSSVAAVVMFTIVGSLIMGATAVGALVLLVGVVLSYRRLALDALDAERAAEGGEGGAGERSASSGGEEKKTARDGDGGALVPHKDVAISVMRHWVHNVAAHPSRCGSESESGGGAIVAGMLDPPPLPPRPKGWVSRAAGAAAGSAKALDEFDEFEPPAPPEEDDEFAPPAPIAATVSAVQVVQARRILSNPLNHALDDTHASTLHAI
jgi:hypothetical protein